MPAPVAVNASPRSLLDPTFPRLVTARLAAFGVPGQDLVIELTESLTLGQAELVGGVLRQLRGAGVRLALDDFGTGYSSLAMLAKVPVYELKIDRSFVPPWARRRKQPRWCGRPSSWGEAWTCWSSPKVLRSRTSDRPGQVRLSRGSGPPVRPPVDE